MTTKLRVLRYLAEHGPIDATSVGAGVWRDLPRRGRVCSVNGGGDYAMQMLLGRMRKQGLARVAIGEGSSQWELTAAGRVELERLGG